MKFAFIREKKVAFPVATMCRLLGVSTSGFYDWLKTPESTRTKQDVVLAAKIADTHERSRGRYGRLQTQPSDCPQSSRAQLPR